MARRSVRGGSVLGVRREGEPDGTGLPCVRADDCGRRWDSNSRRERTERGFPETNDNG